MKENEEAAFPHLIGAVAGLSKREWFAGMALAGLSAQNGDSPSTRAIECFAYADAMIEESQRDYAIEPRKPPRLKNALPIITLRGSLCCLCDGTSGCEHPQMECLECGVIGLSENMPTHNCVPKTQPCP